MTTMCDLPDRSLTVMGPAESVATESNANLNSAPKFMTNVTSKVCYRDSLRRWIRMITKFDEIDKPWEALHAGAGHTICMSCVDKA